MRGGGHAMRARCYPRPFCDTRARSRTVGRARILLAAESSCNAFGITNCSSYGCSNYILL